MAMRQPHILLLLLTSLCCSFIWLLLYLLWNVYNWMSENDCIVFTFFSSYIKISNVSQK